MTPSASVSATPTIVPLPTGIISANLLTKVKAVGPIDQVVAFLKQVLSFLNNQL